jgi:hypothetical protein
MSIVTLALAKRQLNIADSDTGDDQELQLYVDAITGVVEDHLHQVVEQRTVTDELELTGLWWFTLRSRPVISLTSIIALDRLATWNVATLHVSPSSGVVRVLPPGIGPFGRVAVTYEAGYAPADVPARFVRGALVILQHVWETQRGSMGAPVGVVGGEEAPWDPRYSFSIPRKALEWLGPPAPVVA